MKIGIRSEDKSPWERRSPLIPKDIQALREQGISIVVQASAHRVFSDNDFRSAGIPVQTSLKDCDIIIGIKEIPKDMFEFRKIYLFFAHVIKGQPYNMPMLERMMELETTLLDYERIVDGNNRRLIFFGRHAGMAGMINTLWALGQRLEEENIENPFSVLRQAKNYRNLEEAREELDRVAEVIRTRGIPEILNPLIVGFTGYGNVSQGAQDIFDILPFRSIEPEAPEDIMLNDPASRHVLYKIVFREKHMVQSIDGSQSFDLNHYYREGVKKYRSQFYRYLPQLTVLVNGIYWDARYPRLMTIEDCRNLWNGTVPPKLKVIGDITCDPGGSIECTVESTSPDDPVYVYDPRNGVISHGFKGWGPLVMAVDILPTEIPYESSCYFSSILREYIPLIAAANYKDDFARLTMIPELKGAMILHRGTLTPDYRYLRKHL
ncbi:MAG: hypothetical protein JW884_13505 [Deltaproteobacteria bacterium]|nr:hypothetical protein [Deltaproteobacteria bacterium]